MLSKTAMELNTIAGVSSFFMMVVYKNEWRQYDENHRGKMLNHYTTKMGQ